MPNEAQCDAKHGVVALSILTPTRVLRSCLGKHTLDLWAGV